MENIGHFCVRPKPDFGTANQNQDQDLVSVEKRCFAFDKSQILDKEKAKKYCKG